MNDSSEVHKLQRRLENVEKEVQQIRSRLAELARTPPAESKPHVPEPPGKRVTPPPVPSQAKQPTPPVTPAKPPPRDGLDLPLTTPSPSPDPPQPAPPVAARKARESQLGAWWATRLGALFAVICVVFFAVYVSKNAGPWLRFAELLGISAGITLGGLWLERTYQRYGAVLFGSGLALLYFSAYAAYGVPAVKVIHSPEWGTTVQFLAVVLMVGCAFWRNESTVATMAIFFGYIAATFSFTAGLTDYALNASLLLGVAASVFYIIRRWPIAFGIAVPLAYLVYFTVAADWGMERSSSFNESMGYLMAHMLVFGAADVFALRRKCCMPSPWRSVVQLLNTSAALFLGFLVAIFMFPDDLSTFYFLFGGVLLAAAIGYYLAGYRDTLMQTYLVKSTGLIALGLVVVYAGWFRWMALLVQSGVLLASARKTRMWIVEAITGLVWLVSLGYFYQFIYAGGFLEMPVSITTKEGLLSLGYLAASTIILCCYAQWFSPKSTSEKGIFSGEISARSMSHGVYGIALGAAAVLVGKSFALGSQTTYLLSLLSVGLVLGGVKTRNALPIIASLLPLFYAHQVAWTMDPAWQSVASIWMAGLAPVVATLVIAGISFRQGRHKTAPASRAPYLVIDIILHIAWLGTMQALLYKTLPANPYLFCSALLAVLVLLLSRTLPLPSLTALSVLPLVIGWVYVIQNEEFFDGFLFSWEFEPYRTGAALVAFLYAGIFSTQPSFMKRLGLLARGQAHQWAHTLLAGLFIGYAIYTQAPSDVALLGYAVSAFLWLAVGRFSDSRPALAMGEIFVFLMLLTFIVLAADSGNYLGTDGLGWTLGAAAVTMAFTMRLRRALPDLEAWEDNALRWLNSVVVLYMVFRVFTLVDGRWENYVTVSWGFSAIALFLLGLWDRSRPLRLVGLIGLACCIPRVFLIDIRSTLYRIAAFGVLGIVLLLVGFLYHKYRHLIDPDDEDVAAAVPSRKG